MTFSQQYSGLDRTLHNLAFGNIGLQKMLADMEDQIYRGKLAGVAVTQPVFITSLPRAGTTLLLETVAAQPAFATHTYRQMPFVLCPLLWNTLSQRFHKRGELQERAHGDGMHIGFDSAEAFEEVAWKSFWPGKYHADHIETWNAGDTDDEFTEFFVNHVRKIVLLNGAGADQPVRYVSKNNANVARIPSLTRLFPDCVILVPFRAPLQHAMSLQRQHRNFLQQHAEDPFTRRYMEAIGHLEFGALLRPFDFGGWFTGAKLHDPEGIAFWVTYWNHCFTHVLALASTANVRLIDYDRCCAEPAAAMDVLSDTLAVGPGSGLAAEAARYRQPRLYDTAGLGLGGELEAEAMDILNRLKAAAIF